MDDTRICIKCNTQKSLTDYHKKTGYPNDKNTVCKECLNKYNRFRRKVFKDIVKLAKDTSYEVKLRDTSYEVKLRDTSYEVKLCDTVSEQIYTGDPDDNFCLYYGIASFC